MTTPVQPWRRAIAAFLSLLLGLGPLSSPAYAAVTLLADDPIAFVPKAPPNVVLTVDDSTSMLSDFLPDYVIRAVPNTAVPGFCRDTNGAMNVACGFIGNVSTPEHIYHQGSIPFPNYADGNPPNASNYGTSTVPGTNLQWPAPVHANALNRLYYDPAITYRPPTKADGTSYPNVSVFTTVNADPFSTEIKNVNLTSTVNVGMWCNSDWPVDQNPDPSTGGGNHCRVNGYDYTAAHNAPSTPADYHYPWARVAPAVSDTKYFARAGGNKLLYCDTASDKFPKTCTTTSYKCNTGTYVPPTSTPQTCVYQSDRMGCVPTNPGDYNPVGCNVNPAYGSPGPCTGAECLPCSCTNSSVIGKNAQCKATSGTDHSNANCGCNNSPPGVPCSLGGCSPKAGTGAGTCSDGSAVVPVQTCSPVSASCTTQLVDPITKVATGVTILQDSNGAGEVCRHNNQAYADGTIALPFNYSTAHAKYKTQINSSNCGSVASTANVPRHYWKVSIEWCNNRIAVGADNKWRGFGTGTCQDERDASHPYPRFYKYGVAKTDPAYADNVTYSAFERVDLTAAKAPFVHTFQRAGSPVTITRTYIEEMTNYANWFAYYRTRIQAAKTVISQNFAFLDDQFRVGFHVLSNDPVTTWVNVAPFDLAQKSAWYTQLFGIQIRRGEDTPNMEAIVRVGELFRNGTSATLNSPTDPIVLSCQRNFHMLFTDGIQNQLALPATLAGNRDATISIPVNLPLATPPLINAAAWPNLYKEGATSIANSLGDYAMMYWADDLRPLMTNNVITGRDPATWQHLNFAALSLGTEGTLNARSTSATEAQIAAGTILWPTPVPNTFKPTSHGVDDLWHAAVNGRGRFVNAKTSQELGRGIVQILRDLSSPKGSDAGASLENANLSPTASHVFIGSFDGPNGTVKKVLIDPTTATPTSNVWDAATALTTQLAVAPGRLTPWNTHRRIVTTNTTGVPVAFQPGSLDASQLSTLGPDLTTQTRVIEYLRGSKEFEGAEDGQFRARSSPMGDVVNGSPVFVGENPNWPYLDGNDPGYSTFRATARAKRVYVPANDGMLHALDETDGSEAWAFIPRDLFRGLPDDKEGLVGLTYQEGGLPFYEHRYYVNATPRVVDVDFGGPDWRSLLVGGLGKGGKSYYALDVTSPGSVIDEASAAAKVLWEFRNADLGYTYGRPLIAKTRAFGWTVIVPTGYNNASGVGKIFVLRASDGVLLKTMSTSFGTPGNPSGLAGISGYVKDYRHQLVEQVYGGDLYGNVWRFNVEDANDANWTVDKIASLTDSGGTPQPVTMAPQIEVDLANGVDRWVFVGTGRLLHEDDLTDTQQQSMYAVRDGTYDTPLPTPTTVTRSDLSLVDGIAGLGTGVIPPKGWYDDLPAGSRMITPPVAAIGFVGYVATGTATDPCEAGQPAHVFARGFSNGESTLADTSGTPVESMYVPEGGAALNIVKLHDPSCTGDCIPEFRIVVSTKKDSTVIPVRLNPLIFAPQHRLSFRFLQQ
jgi:type IV pilus assembly protein PilY1